MWSIMAFIVIGMVAGWLASFIVRRDRHPSDWGMLLLVGVAGSLAGGIVANLLMGEGFSVQPGGLISSVAFACLFLWLLTSVQQRRVAPQKATASHGAISGAHRQRKGGAKHHKR
jgi:uncharacterized membrane protein YeaQ/YmgE (transglycosylase-associated protein family)